MFKHGIVLYACRHSIVAACYHLISSLELDIHSHICSNLFNIDNQFSAGLRIEVATCCHLIACRHILCKYGIVLHACRYSVITTRYYFVSILELDIHGYTLLSLHNRRPTRKHS